MPENARLLRLILTIVAPPRYCALQMASKKKFYAVAVGRVPGIYDNWPRAKAQVEGFPGARYQGFATLAEAKAWLAALPAAAPTTNRSRRPARQPSLPGWAARPEPPEGSEEPENIEGTAGPGETVTIYTDGGALGNPGPGGYGVVQLYNGRCRELSGGFRLTTNNRMELMACIVALSDLKQRDRPIELYSDSSYVVNGISKGWARGWRRRGWRKSDGRPALNPDLWERLLLLAEELPVKFNWVRGHAGNPLNERCDRLAVAAARQPDLPADTIYENNQNSEREDDG